MGVVIQPLVIPATVFQRILFPPFKRPIPITAPTIAWELETGTRGKEGRPWDFSQLSRATEEKINNTKECDQTTTAAITGDRSKIPLPTVSITRLEKVKTPTAMAIPPSRKSCWAPFRVIPKNETSPREETGTKTPITLAILLAPRE